MDQPCGHFIHFSIHFSRSYCTQYDQL